MDPEDIIHFWFVEITPKSWWEKDAAFDQLIQKRFGETYIAAAANELWTWRETAAGALAEIIVLDQFSRNMFRGSPKSFATDALALALAQTAVQRGFDQKLTIEQRSFLYLPYMHSESRIIHTEALHLYSASGLENNLDYEKKHKAIIDRFGRYPHRNEILGRQSTPKEIAFLKQPGSSF